MTKLAKISVGGKNPIRIMGILNTSPESFFKKSIHQSKNQILNSVKAMEADGADFIDVGGMSTAPYLSTNVSEKIESERILNAIKIIQNSTNIPISIDTVHSSTAKLALENGVEIINDISGLKYDSRMASTISKYSSSVILCAFSKKPISGNLISSTQKLLDESIKIATDSKISLKKIVLDPSIGFFRKTGKGKFFTKINSDWVQRDLEIIKNLSKIKKDLPILISISNKSFLGEILEKKDPSDRIFGSIAAEAISVMYGADIIRTHNVSQTKDAITIAKKLIK
ncbi:MAG: dihydropteroate synthase [Nitrosopumilus sp.]